MEGLRKVETMARVSFLEMAPGTVGVGCRTVERWLSRVWNTQVGVLYLDRTSV